MTSDTIVTKQFRLFPKNPSTYLSHFIDQYQPSASTVRLDLNLYERRSRLENPAGKQTNDSKLGDNACHEEVGSSFFLTISLLCP
jgi:hypothetical protein